MKSQQTLKALIVTLFLASVPAIAQEQAQSAARFIDSIGVDAHFGYDDTEYRNIKFAVSELTNLGVTHVRDGLSSQSPAIPAMAAAGIKYVLVSAPPYDTANFQAIYMAGLVNGVPSVEGWEAQNEPDLQPGWQSWIGPNVDAMTSAATPGRLATVGSGLAYANNASSAPSLAGHVMFGNFHPYPGGQNPSILYPGQIQLITPLYPGLPLLATETGYHNALNGQNDQPAIDEATGAKYVPRLFLEGFNAGVFRTYIYELFNEVSPTNPALQDNNLNCEQCNWGLIDQNGREKPAYTALKNLLTVVKNGDAENGSPTSLTYSLTGGTNIHHTLLQKAPGVFDLILWQDVTSWDKNALTPININPQSVTLNVTATKIVAYTPSVSGMASAWWTNNPTTAILSVPDSPLVVEIFTN